MAHQVEQMFSVKETPWHKLGRVVQEAPTVEEAIKLAGLDWKVVTRPLFVRANDGAEIELTTHQQYFRNSDGKQLAVLTKNFHPLQNDEAFKFFNPFIESGLASLETAGSLREGKTVWILAKLNTAPLDVGGGDTVQKMLLLSNSHDGTMAVRVSFTPIRVVCANTLQLSHNDANTSKIRIFHSSQVNQNLDRVREIVNAADAKFEATSEQYKALARAKVNQSDLEKYVVEVFDIDMKSERAELAKKKAVENIQRLFETGYGSDLKSAKGTYWGLYNAVTQYISYERGSDKSRLEQAWFGNGMKMNERALDLALEAV